MNKIAINLDKLETRVLIDTYNYSLWCTCYSPGEYSLFSILNSPSVIKFSKLEFPSDQRHNRE